MGLLDGNLRNSQWDIVIDRWPFFLPPHPNAAAAFTWNFSDSHSMRDPRYTACNSKYRSHAVEQDSQSKTIDAPVRASSRVQRAQSNC